MAQKRAKKRKSRGIPLWCIPCLLMAGGLLVIDRLGGSDTLTAALSQLAGNADFVQAALSSEIGALGWESVSTHDPGEVSISEVGKCHEGVGGTVEVVGAGSVLGYCPVGRD